MDSHCGVSSLIEHCLLGSSLELRAGVSVYTVERLGMIITSLPSSTHLSPFWNQAAWIQVLVS